MRLRFSLVPAIAVFAGVLAVACGPGASEPSATPTSIPQAVTFTDAAEPTPALSLDLAPTAEPEQAAILTSEPYDADRMMYRLYPGIEPTGQATLAALEEVRLQGDVSQVPILVEAVRFVGSARLQQAFAATLRDLTGQAIGLDHRRFTGADWADWMEWLGKHREEYGPPEGYWTWKGALLSRIHPRFVEFFVSGQENSRIDLTEVVWGGVIPDGIPDLLNPPAISAGEADFLGPEERVFGASINGEHRAYPLRITNPHEMVNDVLGGEPISLVW